MVGTITSWDILAHPIATIRCFGWQVFFRAIAPWQHQPFLTQVRDAGFFGTLPPNVPRILERCIDLELRAKRVYQVLATALDDQGLVGLFFAGLVEQEQCHADLLELVRVAAMRGGWKATSSIRGRTTYLPLSNRWKPPRQPCPILTPWMRLCGW